MSFEAEMQKLEAQPSVLKFTPDQRRAYRKQWNEMPYGGSIGISYDMAPDAIIRNCERLKETLTYHAKLSDDREKELNKMRDAVRGLGYLLKIASKLSDDV